MFDLSFSGIIVNNECVEGCAPLLPELEWELPEETNDGFVIYSKDGSSYITVTDDGMWDSLINGYRFADIWWR